MGCSHVSHVSQRICHDVKLGEKVAPEMVAEAYDYSSSYDRMRRLAWHNICATYRAVQTMKIPRRVKASVFFISIFARSEREMDLYESS